MWWSAPSNNILELICYCRNRIGSTLLSKSNLALTAAIISTCVSSVAVLFQSEAAKHLPLIQLLCMSHLLGGLAAYCLMRILGGYIDWNKIWLHRADLIKICVLRFILGGALFWIAMQMTVGIKAIFFTKAEPYFVLLWAWIFDKAIIPKKHLFLLLVHFAGAAILSGGLEFSIGEAQLGDLLLVLAVAFFAFSYRYAARISKEIPSLQLSATALTAVGLLYLPAMFIYSTFAPWAESSAGWINLLISIPLWNLLGLPLWFVALRELPGWLVSALRSLGPLLAAPIAFLYFDQSLSFVQALGAVIVLSTSLLLSRERR